MKRNLRYIWKYYILEKIIEFFYESHSNGIYGPGSRSHKTFKTGNLALVISILTVIGLILYIFLT